MNRLGFTCVGALLALAISIPAGASPIQIYVAPDNFYQNTENNPCVFYGPGGCSHDPAGWPTPAGPTNQDFGTLTRDYVGADFAEWSSVVGLSFILGLDVNQSSENQTLTEFTITFRNSLNAVLSSYSFAPPIAVPDVSNGVGYADYILAAGCSGTTSGSPIATCSQYIPFVAPIGTARITLTYGYGDTGNDGPDKVFVIPATFENLNQVPEPGSLLLLGSGFAGIAAWARKRRAR